MNSLIGKKIKDLRIDKGFSLEQLGEITETSKSYLWEIENRRGNPTIDKLAKIALALGVTTDYLAYDEKVLTQEVVKNAFFTRFNSLSVDDQIRIEQIIDSWSIQQAK